MAFATTEFDIGPEDGWVAVAVNPQSCFMKAHGNMIPWFFAITPAAAPATGIIGIPMGAGGEPGENNIVRAFDFFPGPTPSAATVWVRTVRKADSVTKMKITVITS